jgi:hypothetical protein
VRLVLLVGAFLLILTGSPGVASAHGGALVMVHSDGRGSVWLTARWQDGHPVTDPLRATLTAKSAAGSVGPVDLQPRGDVLAYGGVLASGSWQVVVQVLGGQCRATVPVGESARVAEVACLIGASGPPPSGRFPLWTLVIAVALLAVVAAGFAGYRRSTSFSRMKARE